MRHRAGAGGRATIRGGKRKKKKGKKKEKKEVAGEGWREKRLRQIRNAESQQGACVQGTEALLPQFENNPVVQAGTP